MTIMISSKNYLLPLPLLVSWRHPFGRLPNAELQLFEGGHMFLHQDPAAIPAITAFLM